MRHFPFCVTDTGSRFAFWAWWVSGGLVSSPSIPFCANDHKHTRAIPTLLSQNFEALVSERGKHRVWPWERGFAGPCAMTNLKTGKAIKSVHIFSSDLKAPYRTHSAAGL